MQVHRLPVVVGPIYLADIHEPFAQAEGEVPKGERVWVKIRQATEGDTEQRYGLVAPRAVEYAGGAVVEKYTDNKREHMRMEAFWTLDEAGNLTYDDGKPVFSSGMTHNEFSEAWWKLPAVCAEAIHKAVLSVNVDWDWDKKKGEV